MRSVKHGKRRGKTRSFWTAKNRHNSSKRKKKAVKGFGKGTITHPSIKKPTRKAGEEMEVDGTDHGQVAVPERKGKKSTAVSVLAEVLEKEVAGAERSATARNKRKKDKKREKMAQRDRDFCLKMLERHGNNYEAMARDPENIYQLTSTRLERKIDRFKKSSLFKDDPDEIPTI